MTPRERSRDWEERLDEALLEGEPGESAELLTVWCPDDGPPPGGAELEHFGREETPWGVQLTLCTPWYVFSGQYKATRRRY